MGFDRDNNEKKNKGKIIEGGKYYSTKDKKRKNSIVEINGHLFEKREYKGGGAEGSVYRF